MLTKLTEPGAMKFIDQLEGPFKQLPHLPDGITKFLADVSPWLSIIGAIFSALAVIGTLPLVLGTGALVGGMAGLYYPAYSPMYAIVSVVGSLITAILLFSAFSPLRRKDLSGWVYLFWTNIVAIVVNVIGIAFMATSIIGAILGAVIGLYVLFEVKKWFGPTGKVASTVAEMTE